jgi:hypothetical protein
MYAEIPSFPRFSTPRVRDRNFILTIPNSNVSQENLRDIVGKSGYFRLNARPRVRGAPGISQIDITIHRLKYQVIKLRLERMLGPSVNLILSYNATCKPVVVILEVPLYTGCLSEEENNWAGAGSDHGTRPCFNLNLKTNHFRFKASARAAPLSLI